MKPAHAQPPAEPARDLAAEIRDLVASGKVSAPEHSPAAREQLLLEQKFAALNQLSAGIAHEFNNVIAGVLGSAELAAMDMHEGHPAHQSLQQIFEASRRGREFLHKVRLFSLRPAVKKKSIPLAPVIEEAVQIFRGLIPEKVRLQLRLNPACPAVSADAAQIHQVMLDLCLHCWQGLPERRGQLTVALEFSHVPNKISATVAGEHCVRLSVSDDSPGLDQAALEKIFDPFHTRRVTAKKMGLELFQAREVIRAHGGELVAESEPGHGLAFHIYLPVA